MTKFREVGRVEISENEICGLKPIGENSDGECIAQLLYAKKKGAPIVGLVNVKRDPSYSWFCNYDASSMSTTYIWGHYE